MDDSSISSVDADDTRLPPIDSDDEYDENYFDFDDWPDDMHLVDPDSDTEPQDELEDPAEVRAAFHRQQKSSFIDGYVEAAENSLSPQEISDKTVRTITFMKDEGLNLAIFTDAVFWGNAACNSQSVVVFERTAFMGSKYLGRVLGHMWKPPPPSRAVSGREVVREFALGCAQEVFTEEMNNIAAAMRPGPDPLSHESLTSVDFEAFGTYLRTEGAPMLWALLMSLAWSTRQASKNTMKNPFHVSNMCILYASFEAMLT